MSFLECYLFDLITVVSISITLISNADFFINFTCSVGSQELSTTKQFIFFSWEPQKHKSWILEFCSYEVKMFESIEITLSMERYGYLKA